MHKLPKRFFLLIIVLTMTAGSVLSQANRTVQDVQAETYERNQAYNNPSANPFRDKGKRNGPESDQSPNYHKAAREALRTRIRSTLTGQALKVVKIIDGDTLEVGNGNRRSIIHIVGVDAPEEGQPGWKEAKDKLTEMLLDKDITIKYSTFCPKHTSGVFLTRVAVDGHDVGAYLLENGLAWYDDAYDIFFNEMENEANLKLWKDARSQKIGIWKNGKASEPWDYAKSKGKKLP